MQVKRLDHINFTVRNLHESIDWYRRVFGFRLVEEGLQDGQPWCIARSGDAMLCMYEAADRIYEDRFDLDRRGLHGVSHFAFAIDDLPAWERTVAEQSLEVRYQGAVEWPHSTSWYITDPTGYEIEVALWKEGRIEFSQRAGEPFSPLDP